MESHNGKANLDCLSASSRVPLAPPMIVQLAPLPPPPPNQPKEPEIADFLKGYPFCLQFMARKKSCDKSAIDVMRKYGPEAEFRFSIELNITSHIQLGPTCGITAALMLIHDDSKLSLMPEMNSLVLKGRALGLTNYGEMFSAHHLSQLISQALNIPNRVLDDWRDSLPTVIEHLLNRMPILVPYDYSAQITEPGYKNGANAHWAILVGFCYNFYPFPSRLDGDDSNETNINNNIMMDNSDKYYTTKMRTLQTDFEKELITAKDVCSFIFDKNFWPKNLYFYGRHSRTNKVCLWNYCDLWRSNSSLASVREKYMAPGVNFVVPDNGDLSQTLARKVILVEKLFQQV